MTTAIEWTDETWNPVIAVVAAIWFGLAAAAWLHPADDWLRWEWEVL